MHLRTLLLTWTILSTYLPLNGQDQVDSLHKLIPKQKGVALSKSLNALSEAYLYSAPDSAWRYGHMAMKVAREAKSKTYQALAHYNLGYCLFDRQQLDSSYLHYMQALQIFQDLDSLDGVASCHNDIGYMFQSVGDKESAITQYLKAREILERQKKTRSLAGVYNNLGLLYHDLKSYDRAHEFYQKSLDLKRQLNERDAQAVTLNNIASLIMDREGDLDSALHYFHLAMDIRQRMDDAFGVSQSYVNLAGIYREMDEMDSAFHYAEKAIENSKANGDVRNYIQGLNHLSRLYSQREDFEHALFYSQKAERNLANIQDLTLSKEVFQNIYHQAKQMKNSQLALEYLEKTQSVSNKLNESNKQREVLEQGWLFELNKVQEEADKRDKLKEKEKETAERKQEEAELWMNIILWSSVALILIGLGVVAFLVRLSRYRKSVNRQISIQKKQVEVKSEQLNEALTHVTDSVEYAKNIQSAMLPDVSGSLENVDYSVFFRPKDIVSGDFFWLKNLDTHIMLAVVDCTGHGVPGAMMSVLGMNALDRCTDEFLLREPDAILNKMRELITRSLSTNGDLKDGMDMGLLAIEKSTRRVKFSGAHHSAWRLLPEVSPQEDNDVVETLVRNTTRTVKVAGDRQPVGRYVTEKPFSCEEFTCEPGEKLLLFSDGFPDQFGGPNGKKVRPKRIFDWLNECPYPELDGMVSYLGERWTVWLGDQEQIDDVCLMGIEIH